MKNKNIPRQSSGQEKLKELERKISELDEKVNKIQRSTATKINTLLPIHNQLRMKSKLYYRWHLNPKASLIHLIVLIIYIIIVIVSSFYFAISSLSSMHIKAQGDLNKVIDSQIFIDTEAEFVSNQIIVKFKKESKDKIKTDQQQTISPQNLGIQSLDDLNKELNVQKFEKLAKSSTKSKKDSEIFDYYIVTLPYEEKVVSKDYKKDKKTKKEKVEFNPKVSSAEEDELINQLEKTLKKYKNDPNVEYVQPNYIYKTTSTVPNDEHYNELWAMPKIQAPEAWDTTTGSSDVTVAVIDTGVDYNHEDLSANIWTNENETPDNGIDDDSNGYIDDYYGWDFRNDDKDPMDDHGHGTHCSGTIAAVGNNNIGVAGVTWNTKIMSLKFLSASGSGSSSDGASAIIYAADSGADVLSNSWGGGGQSQVITDAITYAHDQKGCVVVAAAGNDDEDVYGHYPANINDVITVAATDSSDQKASFSNYGSKIDVAAPGVDIVSLRAPGTDMYGDGNHFIPDGDPNAKYYRASGTSMACPHVSGLAALILANNPSLNNEEVRQVIKKSGDDLGDTGWDRYFGTGRINAYNALNQGSVVETQINSPYPGSNFFDSIDITGTSSGTNFQSYQLEYGSGYNPVSWTTLHSSNTSVTNSTLYSWDTKTVEDGLYILKLTSTDSFADTFEFRTYVNINNNPEAPTKLFADINENYDSISLNWNVSSPADSPVAGYQIFKTIDNDPYPEQPLAEITETNFEDSDNILCGKEYYYKIRAYDSDNPPDYSGFSEVVAKPGSSWSITRVSEDSSGNDANNGSYDPQISNDGRHAVFSSKASNLVAGDNNGNQDIFRRNNDMEIIDRVSIPDPSVGETESNGNSYNGSISNDGRYVAFYSYASNLVLGDNNNKYDVFVKDMQTGTVTRASTDSFGNESNDASYTAKISADGNYVAFHSDATNLVSPESVSDTHVFLKDLQTGSTTLVSADSSGNQLDGFSWDLSISGDGRYVAFDFYNYENYYDNIYLKDTQTGILKDISTDSVGNPANGESWFPYISPNGQFVTFMSWASNFDINDTNGESDIYIKNLQTNAITRASTDSSGNQANDWSYYSSISNDGRYVIIDSYASNLVQGDSNSEWDEFVKDMQTGKIVRISTDAIGNQANDWNDFPQISADGSTMTYYSYATNLVPDDNNNAPDVFLRKNSPQLKTSPDSDTSDVGESLNFSITAYDIFDNLDSDYSGSVSFSSSDSQVVLPTDDGTGWVNGQKTFNIILNTAGTQTVTVTDIETGEYSIFSVIVNPGPISLITEVKNENGDHNFYSFAAPEGTQACDIQDSDMWNIPGGNSVKALAFLDGDKIGVIKNEQGDYNFYLYNAPQGQEAATQIGADYWNIPGGNNIVSIAGLDSDGDSQDELAVLKNENGDHNLYIYELPSGDEAKSKIASDLWNIPFGNNVISICGINIQDSGSDKIAVLKNESGDHNLYIYDAPTSDQACTKIASDLWNIPGGNNVISIAGIDYSGNGRKDKIAVLKNINGDYDLYVYNLPSTLLTPASSYGQDLWNIPGGNNIVDLGG